MARVRLNPIFESVRGSIGDLTVRQYGTRVVFSRKPVFRNRIFSTAQKARQERFREAALYAKQVLDDPRVQAVYGDEARAKGKSIRSLIISDFLLGRVPHEGAASLEAASENLPGAVLPQKRSNMMDDDSSACSAHVSARIPDMHVGGKPGPAGQSGGPIRQLLVRAPSPPPRGSQPWQPASIVPGGWQAGLRPTALHPGVAPGHNFRQVTTPSPGRYHLREGPVPPV